MNKPRVVRYYSAFCDLFDGCVSCAVFLSQLVYWHGVGKDGKPRYNIHDQYGNYWLAKSYKEWHEETGITRDKFQRALKVLRDRGMITTTVMRFMGSPTLHVRFLALNGHRQTITAEQIIKDHLQVSDSHLPIPANANADNCNFTTQITTENTTESEPASASLSPSGTPASTSKEHAGQTNPTPSSNPTTNPSSTTQELHMLGKDPLDDHLKNEASKAETKAEKVSKIVLAWKGLMSKKYGFIPSLNTKQKAQLKLLYVKWESDTGLILTWAIANWNKIVHAVNDNHGLYGGPEKPDPAYLLNYADDARACYNACKKADAYVPPPTHSPIAAKLYVKEVKVVEQKATKEQILEAVKYFHDEWSART
jgi:hypothetical protein